MLMHVWGWQAWRPGGVGRQGTGGGWVGGIMEGGMGWEERGGVWDEGGAGWWRDVAKAQGRKLLE